MTAHPPGMRLALARARRHISVRKPPGFDPGLRLWNESIAPYLRDALAVAVIVTLLVAVTFPPTVQNVAAMGQLTTVLALAAAAVGAMSAIFAGISGRLSGDSHSAWLCVAFSLYSLVGIPAGTIAATVQWNEAAMGNARMFTHTTFAALLFVAAFAPRMPRQLSTWSALVLGLLLAAALAGLGNIFPSASLAVTTAAPVRISLAAAWLFTPTTLIVVAHSRRSAPLYRIGLGCEVVAIAHVFRALAGTPAVPLDLTFSALRFFGVLLLMVGTFQLTRRSLWQVNWTQSEQQEDLRLAEIRLQQIAERDHELRNGLAGLAGAAHLLSARADEAPTLHRAVAAELGRLEAMLRDAGAECAEAQPQNYSVEKVLTEQAALLGSAGMDIRLDADRGLRAVGSPATLAQVVSNVLANCTRHAPGSPVRVRTRCTEATITIRISDFGPGVPGGAERDVFEVGTRGKYSGGQGLGLHVSRRLLQAEGGAISIAPRGANRIGCTVMIEVAAATNNSDIPEPASLTKAS
jgi:two-component system, OmpR family, sensor kinase